MIRALCIVITTRAYAIFQIFLRHWQMNLIRRIIDLYVDGFRNMTARPDITERQMELFFLYCSPNVCLMTVACYLLVQKIRISSPILLSALRNITQCGLGIYMVHYFIVGLGYLAIDHIGVPLPVRIPATALFVFAASWGFVALFYKVWPKAAKWIMG